jgi:hypothetical protein
MTPAGWFDQFPPLKPDMEWPASSRWCPRHWAPCPVTGANGIGAATELMQIWAGELAPKGSYSPAAMNRKLAAAGHICCTLGDERMHEIWGRWPAAPEVTQ